ncbi:MAG: two-component regulator propeller domain-containing protein [Akkermansiaceae bacterium]
MVVSGGAADFAAQPGVVVRVWQSQDGLPSNVVRSVVQASDGYLWVATAEGVARFDGFEFELIEPAGEIRRYRLAFARLFTTSGGALWAATYQGGLFRAKGGKLHGILRDIRITRPPRVTQVSEDVDGSVFFKRGDEVGQVDAAGKVTPVSPTPTLLQRFDEDFQTQFSKTQVPSKVRSITQDRSGALWFGGTQGLASYTNEVVKDFGSDQGVSDVDVTVVQPFPGGKVIAGTTNGKVLLGGGGGFKTVAESQVLNHQWVSGILTISAKETCVSTLGSGLYLWDGETWLGFDGDDGLPDSRLTCVLNDDHGHIWLGSLGGIIRVARKDLLARRNDPDAPVKWLRLDHTDGLPSRECIGGYQPAGWKAMNGMLWFPTGSGVVCVQPKLVEYNQVAPPVYLKSARANGILHANANGPITTHPGRARLEFRFVGLSFSAPDKTTYRARLAGLDDSWRELGNQRVAAYEAVLPGEYTFEVMTVNPREDTLRSLVDYLAAFAREFLEIARIPIRTEIARNIPDCPLSTPQRHGIFLAAREVLNNIVKHSGATEVHLTITLTDRLLEITIQDNGSGFEPDYATGGNGLGNLRSRMQEAGGDCRIETFRKQGTTVFLTLPLPVAGNGVS